MTSKSMDILEPMCGSGRFYIPVLRGGYKIDGFDISKDMLRVCIDKCRQIGMDPAVSINDITNFEIGKKYDLIFIPCGSICLIINDDDIKKSLTNIYNHLKEDGVFLVSFLNENAKSNNIYEFVETKRKKIGEETLIEYWKVKYISCNNLLDYKLKYQLVRNDKVIEEYMDFPNKLHDEEAFAELLKETGFSQVNKVKIDGDSSTLPEEKMVIFECKKK